MYQHNIVYYQSSMKICQFKFQMFYSTTCEMASGIIYTSNQSRLRKLDQLTTINRN